MTKNELIKAVSDKTDMPYIDAKKCIEQAFIIMRETLSEGDKITIKYFGTFHINERKERNSYNPVSGIPIRLEAKKKVKFRPSPAIKIGKDKNNK